MRTRYHHLLTVLTVMLAFGAGVLLAPSILPQAATVVVKSDVIPADLTPVWKAWQVLEEKHVAATTSDTTSVQDRVWGMVQGLANAYDDPYTVFMPPNEAKDFSEEMSGSFGGVGMELGIRNNVLTVIAPLHGTPADHAGIRAGDLVLDVDGTSTTNMSIDEAVGIIRGPVGTTVTLVIAREGETELRTVPIQRATIKVPTLETKRLADDITVISLYNFGGTAVEEMGNALEDFINSGSNKLILDLRGNPGGYLEAAVDIANWFLPGGSVIVTEDFGPNKQQNVHRANGRTISDPTWNMVILVDRGSASASEILAGALSEHGKATLIGERTFGKGSVQEPVPLTPDTLLKVTVAHWLTPNGTSISTAGLNPDLAVPLTADDVKNDRDPQLDAAVRYLTTGVLHHASSTTAATATAPAIW